MKFKKVSKNILSIVLAVICVSTTSFAVYKALTIGNKALEFTIAVQTTSGGGGGETTLPTYAVCTPKLVDGMIPVVWDTTQSKWKVVSSSDNSWYNYIDVNEDGIIEDSEKKWANVMMPDTTATDTSVGTYIGEANLGSMFVWIPRYEYKITYYTDSSKTVVSTDNAQTVYGSVDVNFISSDSNTATTGYTIHPAFRNGSENSFANGEWSTEISGFWAAKFEATNSGDGNTIKILPNQNSWKLITAEDIFTKSKTQSYSLDTSNAALINSHMTKNSEWGAISYLTYSKYGVDGGDVYVNNYWYDTSSAGNNKTGRAGATAKAAKNAGLVSTYAYDSINGVNASTTHNIYGIYDLVGGRTEYVASVLDTVANTMTTSGNTKYCTLYSSSVTGTEEQKIKLASKTGDAVGETYAWNTGAVGEKNGNTDNESDTAYPGYLSSAKKFFARGGGPTNGINGAGIMSFWRLDGTANRFRGFRTILIIE